MESRRAILESPSLPKGQCLPQNSDYVPISEGLLQRRGLEVTKQFQPEGLQILDRLETHIGRVWRHIVKSFYALTAQPPPACFLFAPQNDGTRSGKNPRTLGQ